MCQCARCLAHRFEAKGFVEPCAILGIEPFPFFFFRKVAHYRLVIHRGFIAHSVDEHLCGKCAAVPALVLPREVRESLAHDRKNVFRHTVGRARAVGLEFRGKCAGATQAAEFFHTCQPEHAQTRFVTVHELVAGVAQNGHVLGVEESPINARVQINSVIAPLARRVARTKGVTRDGGS